jgi:hypothetical protein
VGQFDFEYSKGPRRLLSEEETLNGYVVKAEFYLDGQLSKRMELPLNYLERALDLFFQYELPDGKHTLQMNILNPHEKVYVDVKELIVFEKAQR